MSSAPVLTPSPDPAPVPAKEIPALTDAYRKAHKSYVVMAGLLASWELIGITLNTKERWGVELKSPSAVPLILFTLVFYSGYKMTIEWLQCDVERRKHFAAKLDYWVVHSIAVVAVGISVVQYFWRIRVVDVLPPTTRWIILLFLCGPPFVYMCISILILKWRLFTWSERLTFILCVSFLVPWMILMSSKSSRLTVALGFGCGAILIVIVEILFARMGIGLLARK